MTNHEIKALRVRLGLSRAKLCALMIDPVTGQSMAPDTLYRWERRLPEVFTLPAWVDRGVTAVETRFARYAAEAARIRAKNPQYGDKRFQQKHVVGGVTIYNGQFFEDAYSYNGLCIAADAAGEPLPAPRTDADRVIYQRFQRQCPEK